MKKSESVREHPGRTPKLAKQIKLSCILFIALLLSALVVISGVMIWREVSDRQKEKEDFAKLAEMIAQPTESKPTQPEEPTAQTGPDKTEPVSEGRNLAPLYEENSDFLGWLCIPGTEINYPVMHTPSDPQKYLRQNFYGEYSASGVPFLDYRCSTDSDNLIIYGHNMNNGTMFGTLKCYTDSSYLSEHSIIEWETASGCKKYTVFAVVYVQITDDWYGFIDASDEAAFAGGIEKIRSQAMLTTDSVPVYGQQLLTLSTCYGSDKNRRLLVIAVQL